MKLNSGTLNVLKNFATINQNLMIKEGSTITTMSAMKNIVAKVNVEETFPKQIAIYDLNEFLSSTSLFKQPIIDFDDQHLTIKEENSKGQKLKYFYSDPSVIDDLNQLKKAASVIQAPDLVFEKNDEGSFLTVKDKKNDTANNFSLEVNQSSQGAKFQFFFKVENLKLLPGSYDVSISSKNISHFKSKTDNVEYWIALEPESTYEV